MDKRGEKQFRATGSAILIIIITTILVLYILFLPPEDRAILLGDENETNGNNQETTDSGYNKTLLKERIGRLDFLKFDQREYDIPSFRIYSEEAGNTLKSTNSLYVMKRAGDQKFFNLSFEINKKLTSNVVLSFNVKDAKGRLEILLNGNEIFNGAMKEGTPRPLELPKDILDYENKLEFKVSSPGWMFWRTNRYELENVMITGNVLDLSHSASRQYFYISEVEKQNLEESNLKYYLSCDVRNAGSLSIYLNGEETFSGVGDCGVYVILPLDVENIFEGKNELEFVATEGSYLFDRVTLKTELEDMLYPVYYFDLDEELFYDEELKEEFNVTLKIRFVNDDDKRLEYLINGRRRHIITDSLNYIAEINDYVRPETNSLELIPNSVIDIAELKVLLDEE